MRETCTSGSVGAPGSNLRGYPTEEVLRWSVRRARCAARGSGPLTRARPQSLRRALRLAGCARAGDPTRSRARRPEAQNQL